MIKSLRLINWKSFADATLYIDPLTVVIGMNASGKSNILDALCFLQRIASGVPIATALAGDNMLAGLRGGLDLSPRHPHHHFTLTTVISDRNNKEFTHTITVTTDKSTASITSEEITSNSDNKKLIHFETLHETLALVANLENRETFSKPHQLFTTSAHSLLIKTDSLPISEEIKDASRSIKDYLQSIFILDPIPSHMRGYVPLSDTLKPDAANIAGVLASLSDAERSHIESTLTAYLQQLPERDIERVWTERVGRLASDAMLYCEENWGGKTPQIVDARGMSDGTLRFLAVVAALLTCKRGSLLVIEEVDNGLHPSRADTLVDMLRTLGARRNIDVIVTTHNPALLNALGPEMVPFISVTHRDASGASAITLLEDIEQLPKLMAGGPLGRIVSEGRLESALQHDGE
ncbi:AAA family ATPase [Desulfovibrio aerotolerans]|uniref:AAA family ATPase n=1 Tax=Solidesulfovibrio aerotolerans TaxID=295255 RepID=A0A7C9MGF9_9BACT|nr:ATP-binding protein [Solidesulfovibrio aerotolerans]MYL81868.1 AAA family ATPase [Solidesulfovibrio aerotolerans]